MNKLNYVDPFWGNGEINLKEPRGIAATWFFIKAQTGNTHPGACLPLNMLSSVAYNGAYPTGYGVNAPNSHGKPAKKHDKKCVMGFSHYQHSGTGAIGKYYNYFITTPSKQNNLNPRILYDLKCEKAEPGRYYAEFGSFKADTSITANASVEKYAFSNNDKRIIVNFTQAGIDFKNRVTVPSGIKVSKISNNTCKGMAVMEGIPVYVYVILGSDKCKAGIFKNGEIINGENFVIDEIVSEDNCGMFFDIDDENEAVEIYTGYSFLGYENAKENAFDAYNKGFIKIVEQAKEKWEEAFENITVKAEKRDKKLFYSAYYHSLIKPGEIYKENPFTGEKKDTFCDFCTMWDIYKTQLPFIVTLYPKKAERMINSLLDAAEHYGYFPNALLLSDDMNIEEKQARCLAFYTIIDAFYRKIPGIDYKRAMNLMKMHLKRDNNKPFFENGVIKPNYTHTLDLAGACNCVAVLADHFNDKSLYEKMKNAASNWINAYDKSTGLLKSGEYYEGGLWNYSFRLQHDMKKRIEMVGEDKFVKLLDEFFGYNRQPVTQPSDPKDSDYMDWGFSLNSFEGYNNEPDMETPYAYIYAKRHDRTCEVTRAGYDYMFTTGKGGIPGNNDSGGLSSCYMWNCMGIFPVTGQPLFLLGSPVYEKTVLKPTGGEEFVILAKNNPKENIYVEKVYLNGKKLNRFYITVEEFINGGKLEFIMSNDNKRR